jgi:hypothetical protein
MAVSTAGIKTNINFNQYSKRLKSVEEMKPQITAAETVAAVTENFSRPLRMVMDTEGSYIEYVFM